MKLSHSSSFSSSTTGTTTNASFDIYNTRKATAQCFTGVLRRIFCSRALPTHPSDHTIEPNSALCGIKLDKGQEHKAKDKVIDVTASPGIVARLMGLETLPIQVHQSPKSITRSRSMNSLDELKIETDSSPVHTTLSFREIPLLFEVENEEFLVLTFGKRRETRSREKRKGKSVTIGELKQKKRENTKTREKFKEKDNKENQGSGSNYSETNANPDGIIGPGDQIQCGITVQSEDVEDSQNETGQLAGNRAINDLTKLTSRKNMMKHGFSSKDAESECSSEESSPVSILDFGTFISDPGISTDDSTLEVSNATTKESQDLHETNEIEFTSPQNDHSLVEDQEEELNTSEGKCVGSWKIDINDTTRSRWSKTWTKICNISGREMVQLNWAAPGGKWKLEHEDYEGIVVDFESQIFDQLLDETLQLLVVDLPIQNLNL